MERKRPTRLRGCLGAGPLGEFRAGPGFWQVCVGGGRAAGADNLSLIRMVLTLELERGAAGGDPGHTRFGPGAIAGKQSIGPGRRTSGAEELGNLTCVPCPAFVGKR